MFRFFREAREETKMKSKMFAIVALLVVPAMAMAATTGHISLTSSGAASVLVDPNTPISLPVAVNLDIDMSGDATSFYFWDASAVADKTGYTLGSRTGNNSFWLLNGFSRLDSSSNTISLDALSKSIGYIKFDPSDPGPDPVAFSGVATNYTLSGPGLAPGDSVVISLGDPVGSLIMYRSGDPGQTGVRLFDSVGSLTVTATPEPASLLLLGLGGLFLRRRR